MVVLKMDFRHSRNQSIDRTPLPARDSSSVSTPCKGVETFRKIRQKESAKRL